ncbi:MAG: DNA helicase RecQ [Bacteroidota bacterium]
MDLTPALDVLKNYFGYDSFRPLQGEIITSVLSGQDTVVLMPTGGGKSVCYQVPAILQKGMGIVISPLIALMKDQVEGLKANGVRAAFLNSSQTYKEQAEIMEMASLADLDLLYVSPEKLLSEDFSGFLRRVKINLFAVDEAHCISAWGHDFRPEYTRLSFIKNWFPDVPVIALTATADKLTRQDISRQLGMVEPARFISSFDRPNLSLNVRPARKRIEQIIEFLQVRPNQSGIIYCLSRKSTEQVAMKLQAKGFSTAFYHAGMTPKARSRVQDQFLKDTVQIICATIAFGMGIDKSNVRWVIHYNLPKNLEGYYQEIGRAGRDGLASDTLLFYSYADVIAYQKFIQESGQREVQAAKLERMNQYASAATCRRKVLLSYFGQHLPENCGNCDVCHNPPQRMDGTVLAQKALSAIYRLKQQVGMGLLIDVLRGSMRREVLENGYDQIKTFGAGRDMSALHWQQLLVQMLNQGLLEIAYDQGQALRLTPASQEVLFEGKKVELVHPSEMMAMEKSREERSRPKSGLELFIDRMKTTLLVLRRELADAEELSPYQVWNDATLEDLARSFPTKMQDLMNVQGLGVRKQAQYGEQIIETVMEQFREEARQGKQGYIPKGCSHVVSYAFHLQGMKPREIVDVRRIAETTVFSHLTKVFEEGYEIDLEEFLSGWEWDQIRNALEQVNRKEGVKGLFAHLGGGIPFHKLRMAMSYIQHAPTR